MAYVNAELRYRNTEMAGYTFSSLNDEAASLDRPKRVKERKRERAREQERARERENKREREREKAREREIESKRERHRPPIWTEKHTSTQGKFIRR